MAENLPGGKVLRSMIWELAILAGAAAGVFCPPFAAQYFFSSLSPLWLSGIFAFCCIAVPYGVGRVLGKPLRAAYLWSILYLCCMGSVFSVILSLLTEAAVPHTELFFAGTAYVAAWFLGLVTPGAPAGLGIREGAMLFLMKGMPIPEADLLLAVLLGRIITIFGDFLFFLESVGIKYASGRKKRRACNGAVQEAVRPPAIRKRWEWQAATCGHGRRGTATRMPSSRHGDGAQEWRARGKAYRRPGGPHSPREPSRIAATGNADNV